MIVDDSMQNIEKQLADDSDGTFKKRLVDVLCRYKLELDRSKQRLLPPDEYNRLIYLEDALNAALAVISNHVPFKNKISEKIEITTFSALFNL